MNHTIQLPSGSSCILRENTWDHQAFGVPVTEIIDPYLLENALLEEVERKNHSLGTKLCCARIQSQDLQAKRSFYQSGFQLIESSCDFIIQTKKLKTKSTFSFEYAKEEHIGSLEKIASHAFQFSRFHEDPFVPRDLAQKRYLLWIQDLVAHQQCHIAINRAGDIIGMFAFSEEKKGARLQLAGLNPSMAGLGFYFFQSIFSALQTHKTISARVSFSNVSAMNLYIQFGFTLKSTSFDFHKHFDIEPTQLKK